LNTLVLVFCYFWASVESSYILVDGLRGDGRCRCLVLSSICAVGGFVLRAGPRDLLNRRTPRERKNCGNSFDIQTWILAVGICKLYCMGLITEIKNYRLKRSSFVFGSLLHQKSNVMTMKTVDTSFAISLLSPSLYPI